MKSAAASKKNGMGSNARDTAREAARRAGLSLGEWLDSVITESAGDAMSAASGVSSPNGAGRSDNGFSALQGKIDALANRLGQLDPGTLPGRGQPGREAGQSLRGLETWLAGITQDLARCSQETPQRVADAISKLNERLDHLILSGRTAASEFERRVAAVDLALDEFAGEADAATSARPAAKTQPVPKAPAPRTNPVEDLLNEIRSRQHDLDHGSARAKSTEKPAPAIRTADLDSHLRTLTRQLEMMRRPCTFDDSVATLRGDLGRIGDALSRAMPRCALDALESEVESLNDRVGRGRAHGADGAAMSAIEHRLAKLQDTLAHMTPAENIGGFEAAVDALSRKIDMLASGGPDVAALQHVETSIAELRGITERVASGEALTKLAGEVRTLAERMDRFAASDDRGALSSLEQRLNALSAKVHTNATNSDSRRLEGMIEALADQLQRLDLGETHRAHLNQIENQIAQLADRIQVSETRSNHADAIERTLAELHVQIEETRADASERQTVKRDLADLRMSQVESDRRIHQALGTIQDTIEGLAHRLAAVETDARAEAARPAYAPAPTRNAPPAAPAPVPAITVKPPQPQPPAPQPAPRAVAPAALPPAPQMRSPIDPNLPGDHPLEPGSPRSRPATPAERIAESEAALGPLRQNAPGEPNEKANFIAAARRAAQAAAAEAAQANGRRSDDRTAASDSDEGGVMAKLKRPLFMSVAAAVLVVGGAHVTLTMLGSNQGHEAQRHVASVPAPETSTRKPAAADETSRSAAPIPGPQLFAPNSIANPLAMAGAGTTPPAAAQSQDITGSLPKTESATVPATSSPDSLPAAIGTPALRAAAVAGNPAAEYEIAVRYAEGRGVPQSFADSARWFERAANKGLAPAQYRLGSFYEKGHGVKKDIDAARKLYISAAEKGNARAMHNLAVLYAEGVDGKPEYKTAYTWFRKAASFGVADSQYNLGILYARGIGVEQNLAESYKWFALAAQQGDQDAGRKRDDVSGRLDPQSLVAAKLAAQTFTVESQPEEAVTVKAPAGGWDRPAAASAAPAVPTAKSKASQQRI